MVFCNRKQCSSMCSSVGGCWKLNIVHNFLHLFKNGNLFDESDNLSGRTAATVESDEYEDVISLTPTRLPKKGGNVQPEYLEKVSKCYKKSFTPTYVDSVWPISTSLKSSNEEYFPKENSRANVNYLLMEEDSTEDENPYVQFDDNSTSSSIALSFDDSIPQCYKKSFIPTNVDSVWPICTSFSCNEEYIPKENTRSKDVNCLLIEKDPIEDENPYVQMDNNSTSSSIALSFDDSILDSSSCFSYVSEKVLSKDYGESEISSGSSLFSMASIESTSLHCENFQPIIIDSFLGENLQDEMKDTSQSIDPPGFKFEGISVVSETSYSQRQIINQQISSNKVDLYRTNTEALRFTVLTEGNLTNDVSINHAKENLTRLEQVFHRVEGNNNARSLDFESKSVHQEDMNEPSCPTTKTIEENGDAVFQQQRVYDSIIRSKDSTPGLQVHCVELSHLIENRKSSRSKKVGEFFGLRRRRYLTKNGLSCRDDLENTNSDMEQDSSTNHNSVKFPPHQFRATSNVTSESHEERHMQSDNYSRLYSQFLGRKSNRSRRASIELKSENIDTDFLDQHLQLTQSTNSISSLCAETGISVILDPLARPSKRMKKSCTQVLGDGDVWIEKVLTSSRSGKKRSFFYSLKTGERKGDEPPTGSSRVIYSSNN